MTGSTQRTPFSFKPFIASILLALSFCMVIAITAPLMAPNAAAQAPSDISKAYFSSGWFEKAGSGEWGEFDAQGNRRYTFKEVRRDNDSVFLYLKQHGVNIEINARENRIYAEWPGQARHVMHTITNMEIMAPPPAPPAAPPSQPPSPPSVNTGATTATVASATYNGGEFIKNQGQWLEITSSGTRYNFSELGHDQRHVYLYDGTRSAFVIMDLSAQEIRYSNGGAVQHLYDVSEFSVISEPEPPVSPPVTPPTPPGGGIPEAPKMTTLEKATCLATGGKIEKAGILGAERCTRPYGDGGMVCSDSSQCQGKCLAGTDDANKTGITGTCQRTDNPFGCFAEVKNGKTEFGLCVD